MKLRTTSLRLGSVRASRFRPRVASVFKQRRPPRVPLNDPRHRITRIAEPYRNRVRLSVLDIIASVRNSVTLTELTEAVRTLNFNTVSGLLNIEQRFEEASAGSGIDPRRPTFRGLLRSLFEQAAQSEVEALANVSVQVTKQKIGVELAFDVRNPRSEALLAASLLNDIREMATSTREAVRDTILDAFESGGNPRVQAREIKQTIGLTQTQNQAVRNFRRRLLSGDPIQIREAMQRSLRDRRFDPTLLRAIEQQVVIPRDKIDVMVSRYRERFVQHRAVAIARTETKRFAIAGQREVWLQARDQGLLEDSKTRRKVILAPDACSNICVPTAIMNRKGVGLEEPFITPVGVIMDPPFHTHCRCDVGLVFK